MSDKIEYLFFHDIQTGLMENISPLLRRNDRRLIPARLRESYVGETKIYPN